MQEIPARAALVSAPDVADGLTTSISRAELEQAIEAKDGPPELILDLTRFSDGEAAETRSLAVSWQPGDLEQLLRQAQGERVTLTFDGETLRQAMEDDVEAHGFREKAVVVAVAVTAVTGIAAGTAAGDSSLAANDRAHAQATTTYQASLGPDDRDFSRMTAEQPTLGPDDRALPRTDPTSQPSLSPDDRAFPRESPAPVAQQPGLSPDDRALPRTDPVSQPSLSPDDRAFPRESPAPVAQPGLSPDDRALPRTDPLAQTPSLSPDDRALPRSTPVAQPSLGPDDRPLPRTDPLAQPQPSGSPADDGTRIEMPSPETIAVIGGIALAITGAAFAAGVAGRRRMHPA